MRGVPFTLSIVVWPCTRWTMFCAQFFVIVSSWVLMANRAPVDHGPASMQSKHKDGKDRRQKLDERRQRQVSSRDCGTAYQNGQLCPVLGWRCCSRVRGVVRNKGKITDMRSSETDERHPRHDDYMNQRIYKVPPIGAAPDDESNVVTVMDFGKNILRVN